MLVLKAVHDQTLIQIKFFEKFDICVLCHCSANSLFNESLNLKIKQNPRMINARFFKLTICF